MTQNIRNEEIMARIFKWMIAFVAIFLIMTPVLKLYINDIIFSKIFGEIVSEGDHHNYLTYKFVYYFVYPIMGMSSLLFLWSRSFFYISFNMGIVLLYEKYFYMDEMYLNLSRDWQGAGLDNSLYFSCYFVILLMVAKYLYEYYLTLIFKILTSKVAVTCVDENVSELLKNIDTSKLRPILVIDDDNDFLKLLKLKLEKQGRNVVTANSALEGIDIAATIKPDVILLDLNMPIVDGVSACKQLKNNPVTKNIKIIGMSADSERRFDSFDDGHFKRDGILTLIKKIPAKKL